MRASLRELDASVPLYQVRTLEQVLSRAVATPRLRAALIGLFGLLSALLAGLGVFGVISYLVSERTHEFGVRMSLGATGADVGRLVMAEALRPVVTGLLLGVLSAAALGRLLRAFLYGVSASDPVSYVVAAAILLAAACAAAVIPARRAVRVDPMTALTAE